MRGNGLEIHVCVVVRTRITLIFLQHGQRTFAVTHKFNERRAITFCLHHLAEISDGYLQILYTCAAVNDGRNETTLPQTATST